MNAMKVMKAMIACASEYSKQSEDEDQGYMHKLFSRMAPPPILDYFVVRCLP
jgi:hypothetical protein